MTCQISREQLWSWIDRDAPELAAHLETCTLCRARAAEIRAQIEVIASDAAALHIPLPDTIGPYAVRRLLGEGGQALVYEAEQTSPRRAVAVKVLKGGPFAGASDLRHFQREIQALAALRHPAIATIHEAGQTADGHHYFAMELVPGVPLHIHVRETRLSRAQRLALVLRIADAVRYAHEHGVVHRDLKPSNILVDAEGNPKVLDFGLARIARPDGGRTLSRAGVPEGTPKYMSPEQLRGDADPLDPRTDVYALGVILYELLTGRPPHDVDGFTPAAVRAVLESPPPRASALDPDLRGDAEAVLAKALERDPAARYATVAAFADDVRRLIEGSAVLAARPRLGSRARHALRRHPRRAAAAAAAILVAAIAMGLASERASRENQARRENALHLHALLLADPIDRVQTARAVEGLPLHDHPVDLVLALAQAEAKLREFRLGIGMLGDALDGPGPRWPLLLQLLEMHEALHQPEMREVRSELDRITIPDDAEAHYLRSLATLDLDRSLKEARRALELDPGHRLALRAAALLSETRGELGPASHYALRLATLEPEGGVWAVRAGDLLLRQERMEEAVRAYRQAAGRVPDNIWVHFRLGQAMRRWGDLDAALVELGRSIERAPSEEAAAWVFYHRAALQWMRGDVDAAIDDYRVASSGIRIATYGDGRLAILLREQGRVAEAESTLADARHRVLDNPWLDAVLACLAGDITPEELLAVADPARPAQRCEGFYYAAEAALAAGRVEDARRWFRACVDTGLAADPGAPLEPMTEHELSAWRLRTRFAGT